MPYIDPTGKSPGYSENEQHGLGLTLWVDVLPLKSLKSAKSVEIDGAYESAVAQLSNGYPASERESWPIQVMESAAVLNNAGVDTPWISAAAVARGISREEMATKIRDMDAQYRQISGALTGRRQALRDQIDAAATLEEVEAISWTSDTTP